jgi:hypothetical protein
MVSGLSSHFSSPQTKRVSAEHLLNFADTCLGSLFWDAMLKAANQELTLNQIEATTANQSTSQNSNSQRGGLGRGGRGGRAGGCRKGKGRGFRFVPLSCFFSIRHHSLSVGGRLKNVADNWALVTNDS